MVADGMAEAAEPSAWQQSRFAGVGSGVVEFPVSWAGTFMPQS